MTLTVKPVPAIFGLPPWIAEAESIKVPISTLVAMSPVYRVSGAEHFSDPCIHLLFHDEIATILAFRIWYILELG